MKKFLFSCSIALSLCLQSKAQADIYPAKPFLGKIYIKNGTIHVGNGRVLDGATVVISNGKIIEVGTNISVPSSDDNTHVVDASGKQIYPGLILSDSDLGLKEIANAVPGSNDYDELGDFNADVRSLVAYDATSMIIGTLRTNGILLASVSPQGGAITGSSSVVQLDAWNWNDAAYKTDNNIHVYFPSFQVKKRNGFFFLPEGQGPSDKKTLEKIDKIRQFFQAAKSYLATNNHAEHNLKLEATKGLFDKTQKLFVHANEVKQMLAAINLAKEFGFDLVIVGGTESWQIADLLRKNNVAVILKEEHALPTSEDDAYDQPYKTPAMLQKAGVLFAINDTHDETRYRNLMFNAGTAVAFGLTKEEALASITSNAAKILGIDQQTGTIEVGKDANIIISEGDILDMRTSILTKAFIQGRDVSLENKQTQLYERYIYKYGLNK